MRHVGVDQCVNPWICQTIFFVLNYEMDGFDFIPTFGQTRWSAPTVV